MISIITWNCQGAGKKNFVRNFRELLRAHKPEVVVVVEPRISGFRATRVISRLNFQNSHRVEARGFAAIYACPQDGWRKFLWRNLETIAMNTSEPWLLGGDFNAILAGHERRNGAGRHGLANKAFQECFSKCNLIDLGFIDNKFTWKRGIYHARLDRFLCNGAWRLMYPEATVRHLPRVGSDHCPLLLMNGLSPSPKAQRPFRFQAAWLAHPSFEEFVK
ncbi:hypothetical protein Tsubulata_024970 [Turnera subulata]|uniref:Endonuclease/exonuclease/phosphatase domain-containing protein n=1 Tax=Turnera subulata TaxID=218843 RepID=A0A9Q0FYI3_9ROSI|nr:hypothetical protein Tsubulata_024970 [Turnera subulata]